MKPSARSLCRRLAALPLLASLLAACAAVPEQRQGSSGRVTWEVVDVTQVLRADGRGIRWDYTLILKETKGVGIQFERTEAVMLSQSVDSAPRPAEYRARLGPNSQLRYTAWCLVYHYARTQGGFGVRPGGYGTTMTMFHRFIGKDDNGDPVTVDIRFPLDWGTGRRLPTPAVAPGPMASSRAVSVPDTKALAGEWQGHYRDANGFDLPLRFVIKDDGSFEAAEGDPVRSRYRGTLQVRDGQVLVAQRSNTGTLSLYEESGKRILAGTILMGGQQPFKYDLRLEPKLPSDTASAVVAPSRPPAPAAPASPPAAAPPAARPPAASAPAARAPSPPSLTITLRYPQDQARLSEPFTVVVADVTSEKGIATTAVTVNGTAVHEQAERSNRSVALNIPVTLREETNVIVVSATEPDGALRQEVRTVTYQVPPGIRVSCRVKGSALRLKLAYRRTDGRTEQREVLIPIDATWELLFNAKEGDALEVTAQNAGESGWVTCEIVIDGTAVAARTEEGSDPAVTCRATVSRR